MASDDTTQAQEVPSGDKTSVLIPEARDLDPRLYYLTEDEAAFFKATTGIDNDEELKAHILMVQKMAYEVSFILASPKAELTTTNLGRAVSLYLYICIPPVREVFHRLLCSSQTHCMQDGNQKAANLRRHC